MRRERANRRTLMGVLALAGFAIAARDSLGAQEGEVRVAAASDLKFAMNELAAEFEKQTGTKIGVTYGSSGNFFPQIQNGAPFDLFFSADLENPRKLEEAGLAEPGTLYKYAVGRIAIWMPAETKLDVAKLAWDSLLHASVKKIAIANPAHAPYGRAAVAALQKAGIYERVKMKLVYGENMSQAAEFVQSGNAQAGIVAISLALSRGMSEGKTWEIPREMHPAIEQGAIVLKSAKNREAARAFLEFARGKRAQEILTKYGFEAPS